ncbi:ChaB family protein [Methanoculleus chikugoensis]|uniref:ChaB family protein n=1 Tax=Methanoculleus chikugoensis TaxID=118126 RepID=UPI000AFA2AFB|nr:ChaB family protein [Methanoculleus chikugoensis]
MREALPGHGRDIYREAFNSAREQYAGPSGRRNQKNSQEEVAHKVAWAAVEQVYEKGAGGEWRRKEGATHSIVLRAILSSGRTHGRTLLWHHTSSHQYISIRIK